MPLSTLEWLNVSILIYLCLFWPIANNFQIIGHLDVEDYVCGCSSGVHNLSYVFAFTWGTWSPWITWWFPRINVRTVILHERSMTQNWPGYPFLTVKSVMVFLWAFLRLILLRQGISLFVMMKTVHSASKVSSTYTQQELPTLTWLWELCSCGNLLDKMLSLPNMPTLLSDIVLLSLSVLQCSVHHSNRSQSSATQIEVSLNVCCTFLLWTSKLLTVHTERSSPTIAYSEL